jgi:predicted DNA-binding transcriptional regulator AlpA
MSEMDKTAESFEGVVRLMRHHAAVSRGWDKLPRPSGLDLVIDIIAQQLWAVSSQRDPEDSRGDHQDLLGQIRRWRVAEVEKYPKTLTHIFWEDAVKFGHPEVPRMRELARGVISRLLACAPTAKSEQVKTPASGPIRYVGSKEFRHRLGDISRTTFWRWERKGEIPKRRHVLGRLGWLSTEVDAWFQTRERRQT